MNENMSIFSKKYWREAAAQLKDTKMLTIAALIVALRVVVKFLKIPLAEGLSISLDAYVNSLGSVIYGPVAGLVVGAVSDILGCIVTGKMGQYFPPFALVEMSSSFIFGLFFWRRKVSFTSTMAAKFTVNLVCNILLTSVFNKWMYYIYYGLERAEAYSIINGVRIAKNLVMFPLEATVIVVVFTAVLPVLARLRLVDPKLCEVKRPSNRHLITEIAVFTALSVGLVLLYIFFLKDIIAELDLKLW